MVKVGTAKALEIFRAAFLPRPHVASRDSVDRYLAQARSRATFVRTSFIALVLLPTLIASIYYGLIASARYVSEAQFIVRGLSSPRSSGLDTLFQTLGVSRTVDDANVVEGYLRSRDAVRDLEARLPLRQIFARDEGSPSRLEEPRAYSQRTPFLRYAFGIRVPLAWYSSIQHS